MEDSQASKSIPLNFNLIKISMKSLAKERLRTRALKRDSETSTKCNGWEQDKVMQD